MPLAYATNRHDFDMAGHKKGRYTDGTRVLALSAAVCTSLLDPLMTIYFDPLMTIYSDPLMTIYFDPLMTIYFPR